MTSLTDAIKNLEEQGKEFKVEQVLDQHAQPVVSEEMGKGNPYEQILQENQAQDGESQAQTAQAQENQAQVAAVAVEDINIPFSQLKEVFGDHPDFESIKQTWQDRNTKAQQYETIAPKYQEYENVLPKIKEPFATPQVKAINAFVTNTGIKDLSVASQFVGKTSDDLAKTPLDLLALDEVMKNPDLLTVTTLNEIKEGIAARYGVTSDVEVADLPAAMRLEVSKASLAIQGKLGAEDSEDYFTKAAKQHSTLQEQQTARYNAVSPKIAELSAALREVSIEVEGAKAVVQVSDDIRQRIQQELTNYVMYNNVELTEDNVKLLRDSAILRAEELNVKALISEAVKASKGVATKQVLTEVHNGQPVVKQAAPSATANNDWRANYLKKLKGQ